MSDKLPEKTNGKVKNFFRTVLAIISWLLVVGTCSWLLAEFLFRAKDNGNTTLPTEQEKQAQLYRCDCADSGSHAELGYHASWCLYYLWYTGWVQKNNR